MKRIVVVLLLGWALPAAAAEKKFALLVGVNKYQHAGLNRLDYAEADVAEFEALLKRSGYETVPLLGEKATLEAIRAQLKALQRKGNGASVVLAAFAGHGIQPEKAKEAYFCPYDADEKVFERNGKKDADWDLEGTMLPLSEVLAYLKASGAESKALLVDACRNDPKAGRSVGFGTEFNAGDLPENLVLLLSCSKDERAFEDREWKHGAFFYHVLKGVREGKGAIEGHVTANSLAAYVSRAVRTDVPVVIKGGARQRPHAIINGEVDFRIELVERKGPKAGDVVEVEIAKGVKMKLCWVPPGKAKLGSPASEKERSTDEAEHEYTSKGFWLGKYAVTQEEWEAVMGENPSWFSKGGDGKEKVAGLDTSRFPVETVSWNDSQAFIRKLNESVKLPLGLGRGKFCLPHEDEWEYAARGGKGNGRAFYFGDQLNGDLANCDGNYPYGTTVKGDYKKRPTAVGSYESVASHPWGLCDMSGNVWQWCENKYDNKNDAFVVRGGSWNVYSGLCRSADRYADEPAARTNFIGCRVVFCLD